MPDPNPSWEPQALIFDMDGTLADTMPAHFVAWSAIADRYGLDFPESRFYAMGGVPSQNIIRTLADEAGVQLDAAAVAREKEDAFMSGLDAVRPVEPVLEVARQYSGRLPMAVATGGYRHVANEVLGHLGIAEWFRALVTADDVEHPKPHPQTFLMAAERLGVDPTRCRAYEDTDLGLASAHDAGMDAVDIRTMLNQELA